MDKVEKILLVDDDDIFLMLAKINIEKALPNASIFTASNGEEAMEFIIDKKQNVDIIFLDLNMPIMDGWDFLEQMKVREKVDQKIIVVTSSIDPSDKRRAEENPLVTSMVEKPLDKHKISLAIKS
ncbi:MAG: response regulator [Ekhidna sp.]